MNRTLRARLAPYLYVLPIVALSGIVLYFSIGFTFYASLTDWNGLSRMNFVGLANYVELLGDRTFWIALTNTLIFLVATITIQAVIGLVVAVIAKERLPGSTFFKALFFLPIAMAPAIIATVFRYLLEANYGTLNETLRAAGLLGQNDSIQWLGADLGIWSMVIINVFQWMGFSMLIYYAALMAVPDDIYEAAALDGAGWWRELVSITIPAVRGTTNVLIVLGIVGALKTFDIVWLTTGGGPGTSNHFLSTFLYQERSDRQAGYASAIGVVILIAAFVLSMIQLRLGRTKEEKAPKSASRKVRKVHS
jgi:raffinose/stachyose/melibiose transport system permease protein